MEQARADTRWLAPTIELGPPKSDGKAESSPPLGELVRDVLSADLTLVNDGVGQLQLVLNNQQAGVHQEPHSRVPHYPPWKHNGLAYFKFGQRVRFGIGYHEGPRVHATVRITDIAFSFPTGGAAQVTLECKDMLSLLETRPDEDDRENYEDAHEHDIVTQLLEVSRSGLTLMPAAKERRLTFKKKLRSLVHNKNQTFLAVIQEMARRLDYEVFASEDGGGLHFELARSLQKNESELLELRWGRDLLSFAPTLQVWDQYTGAYAYGRRGRSRGGIEGASAGKEDVLADMPYERERSSPDGPLRGMTQVDGKAVPVIDAVEIRSTLIDDQVAGKSNRHGFEVTNLDDKRARAWAVAVLRSQARKLLTATAEIIGRPEFRPGMHVRIGGMQAPFDGVYYITRAQHSYGASGYRTALSLRRPGITDPASYPEIPTDYPVKKKP